MRRQKIIVGITGATGAIFGVRILELLRHEGLETHLVISKWGAQTLIHETTYTLQEVKNLATHHYAIQDQSAPISSGSCFTDGMVIVPCSMRTLSAVAQAQGDNLIHRSADVTLKEQRKLVMVIRESPLHAIHLENMTKLAQLGAVIFPPVPAFYNQPKSIDDLVNHVAGRVLDQLGLDPDIVQRWDGSISRNQRAIPNKNRTNQS